MLASYALKFPQQLAYPETLLGCSVHLWNNTYNQQPHVHTVLLIIIIRYVQNIFKLITTQLILLYYIDM